MLYEPINICVVYVPPNCTETYKVNLLSYLNDTMQSSDKNFVFGDFNCPDIDWPTLSSDYNFSTSLCDLVFQYNFTQVITHTQGNILDLILTSSSDSVTDISVSEEFNSTIKSDHFIIFTFVC